MAKKLFDYVIGNPPYQEETVGNNNAQPVYNIFMEASFKSANCVELITPARFLFDAGQTPKSWNRKMLSDNHFKVLRYESKASNIFANTDIKGGVAITIRDEKKESTPIETFFEYPELKTILDKVKSATNHYMNEIVTGAVPYKFTDALRKDYPKEAKKASDSFDLRTNIFEKIGEPVFSCKKRSSSDVAIHGLKNKKRDLLWIKEAYVSVPDNFIKYKLLVSKAVGTGTFGEVFPEFILAAPKEGHTQSFVSIGNFGTEIEALNESKYLKTKFMRTLFGILKKTPDITPAKFELTPLQDFTDNSDIDWSKSIHEIDLQLYKKYNLSEEEINFIETHVKEME